jgi:hypothetical protein
VAPKLASSKTKTTTPKVPLSITPSLMVAKASSMPPSGQELNPRPLGYEQRLSCLAFPPELIRSRQRTTLLHLGGVHFPVTGPARYTMTARKGMELCRFIRPQTLIPIHYEGWTHFRQNRETIACEFANAPEEIRRSIRWLPIGAEVEVTA